MTIIISGENSQNCSYLKLLEKCTIDLGGGILNTFLSKRI